MRRYNPKEIEPKWQQTWRETEIYKTDMARTSDKFYIIPMLPYPSGDLHIGHWYNFAPTDTVARFRRMLGNNVLTTIGFDAFGLPAENAAIKRNIQPAIWTHGNIKTMTGQLQQIGASYDWDHSLATCDPTYYKWNQWLFLKLYEKGLAYRAKALVNWCPKDQTVLANEQVVGDDNVCERCGTPVIQKEMEQWFFKITDYADRLLDDLENVDWPGKVKTMQENWIGKSRGALIDFAVDDSSDKLQVFTTRPDTIYGATFLVVAPEHKILNKLSISEQAKNYIEEASHKTELERKEGEKDKTGVFTGAYAVNPATKEKIPIWIADYVLMSYGTGAIMAVPSHDERDGEFAKKFSLPAKQVVGELFADESNPHRQGFPVVPRQIIIAIVKHPTEPKYAMLNWSHNGYRTFVIGGIEAGETPEEAARREIAEEIGFKNIKSISKIGNQIVSVFHAAHKGENRIAFAQGLLVELEDLGADEVTPEEKAKHSLEWVSEERALDGKTGSEPPELLRRLKSNQLDSSIMTGEGVVFDSGKYDGLSSAEAREKIVADLVKQGIAKERTNYRLRDWLISRQRYWGTPIPIVYCDKCGIQPVPEKDLPIILPEDVEFELTGRSPLVEREDFVNTTCPNCDGPAKRETDTMDTFVDSSWYFLRYLDNTNDKAIFDLDVINEWAPIDHYIGGIEHAILHLLYARFVTKFLHDYHGVDFEEPFKKLTNQGIILGPDGQKMSKSKGNVVNPDEQVTSYGTDSLRLYLMFMGPYEQGGPYSMGGIAGTRRFLDRFWTLVGEFLEADTKPASNVSETALTAAAHRAIKKVTQDLEKLNFNTAIAAMMALVNDLYKVKTEQGLAQTPAWRQSLETLTQLLAPFAPHIAEEIWRDLGHEESVHIGNWPLWDEKLITEETMTLAIQVNGKVRGEIDVPTDISEEEAIAAAKEESKVADYLAGKTIQKTIYVPGRLVSLVVE